MLWQSPTGVTAQYPSLVDQEQQYFCSTALEALTKLCVHAEAQHRNLEHTALPVSASRPGTYEHACVASQLMSSAWAMNGKWILKAHPSALC